MQIETLKDLLDWTKALHHNLSKCLEHCSDKNADQRAGMLLSFFAEHESRLELLVDKTMESANKSALNTWCQEYIHKNPITTHKRCEEPFTDLNTSEVSELVFNLHSELLELYRFLYAQAGAPSALRLLKQLIDLEEHEAMQMATGASQLEDL